MKKKKILMLVCMAVLAVTVVIPVNAAKKTNKKQIQVLNLYQDQKTDIEEAEYLVSYLEDKNIDEESVEKQEKEEWYIDIKTGKITKDSQYKRHFYNDGWTIEFKDDKGKILYSTEDEEDEGSYRVLHEFNKDKFLVVERLESIDERSIYLGFMNAKGKWKQDPWKVDNDLLGRICRRRRCRRFGTDLWIPENEHTTDDFHSCSTGYLCTDPSVCRKYNFKKIKTA